MLDLALFVQSSLVMVLASVLQSSVGYGFGLFAVPLLLIIDAQFVPAPLILASLLAMALVAVQNRLALVGQRIWPLLLGFLIGAPVGAHIVASIDRAFFAYLVGATVAVGLLVSLTKLSVPLNSTSQFLSGVLSNVLGTATGMGGAPIALLYQHEEGPKIRAVLSSVFLVGSALSLAALWWVGLVTSNTFAMSSYLLPGTLLGVFLGRFIAPVIDSGFSRAAILVVTVLSVAYLVVDGS
ncbi:MAG: sulfite exporter TauE/SafE family protein [Pseudomonadota bacterium]